MMTKIFCYGNLKRGQKYPIFALFRLITYKLLGESFSVVSLYFCLTDKGNIFANFLKNLSIGFRATLTL